ncbi:MAG: M48 family metalloprotease [Leptolyngbya sp. IPPAS B-1204]|jgi:heat shock protein HtpX|uniref:Protease HtpX homolog n=1 Tax=Leptolyngbya sp. NK1-12 TaxID=2547451 RepID=A0AA97AH76_9CYAN|nr:MAG: protease HtpX [Leptolyngbya sp. IPPAS B-1204]WNZ25140.1 M48 family metalloprotease [Leptolyngbya sp. NK1-12]
MNQAKTVALLGLLSGLLIALGYWIGGSGGALIGLIIAAVTNFVSWYSSDKIALAAYRAQPLSQAQAPELYAMVERLSQRAGLPMPRLYVVPSMGANAFATGRNPQNAAVAVTQGIVNLLPADELEAVIAHELSHIKNRDTLTQAVAATVAGAISYLAQVMQFGMMFGGGRNREGGNPFGMLFAIILAPLAASVIQMAISRTREFEADAGAARLTGNPRALARALQRLEAGARQMPMQANPAFEPLLIINPFSGQFLANLFATHPSTEARIQNLLRVEQELGISA